MREHLFYLLLVTIMICLLPTLGSVQAQVPSLEGKISGTVTDSYTGQPVGGVTITVGIGLSVNQTTTNSTGQYFIGGLKGSLAGITYNVTAAKAGYHPSSANVTLTTIIDFVPPAIQDFSIAPVFPPLEGRISGYVTDSNNGQPIANAIVTAGIASYVNQTTNTNSTGQYFIGSLVGNLTGITYNVTASRGGYLTSSVNVTLKSEIDFVPLATQNFTLAAIMGTPTPLPSATQTPQIPELQTPLLILTITIPALVLIAFGKRRFRPKMIQVRSTERVL